MNIKQNKQYYIVSITIVFLICGMIVWNNKNILFKTKPVIIYSSGTFKSGDSLLKLFGEEKIDKNDAVGIFASLNSKYNVRYIKPRRKYEFYKSTFGTVFQFNYWDSPTEYFNVAKSTTNNFVCRNVVLPVEKVLTVIKCKIESTLYEALLKEGVPSEIIMSVSDIFAWQIDFFNDLRKGDKFKIVYNQFKYKDNIIKDGEILAAKYNGSFTGEHTSIYFKSKNSKISGYFSPNGDSLRKMFLRAPLNFRRISSYFSHKRFHPILRYNRPHLGIDYAAPTGTPISSIGDGIVKFAGWNDGYGKFIKIRHNSIYTSTYGHLSKIAKGISVGKKVKQGQVIGYVGTTGLSTGPHLDFRITRNGRFVDYLKIKTSSANKIPKEYNDEFQNVKEQVLEYFNEDVG